MQKRNRNVLKSLLIKQRVLSYCRASRCYAAVSEKWGWWFQLYLFCRGAPKLVLLNNCTFIFIYIKLTALNCLCCLVWNFSTFRYDVFCMLFAQIMPNELQIWMEEKEGYIMCPMCTICFSSESPRGSVGLWCVVSRWEKCESPRFCPSTLVYVS